MNVVKVAADSNCYFIKANGLLIDTGREQHRDLLLRSIDPKDVKIIILTHLHYDHIGNIEIFPTAKIYASEAEIQCLENNPFGTVLDAGRVRVLSQYNILPLKKIAGLEIIPCPGHTKGSIALWDKNTKTLFSGDTLFENGIGRTDLPTSVPEEMDGTLKRLYNLKHKTLLAGHDY